LEGKPVDTEATIDQLCSQRVTLGLFFDFGIQYFSGTVARGGAVTPSIIVPKQARRALTFSHPAGSIVLHYPDRVVIFDEAPYEGHYGFTAAREGRLLVYHLIPEPSH
jgi:hypothetical protein